MKNATLVLLGSLMLSTVAMASSSDRIDLGDGLIGITHTENFEYVCQMETKEQGETVNFKSYLDVNFSETNKYRFAVGFVGGGKVAGMIAAESDIESSAKGRCPGLCLQLNIKSDEGGSASVLFSEDPISKIISVSFNENGTTSQVGTCTKNEVN